VVDAEKEEVNTADEDTHRFLKAPPASISGVAAPESILLQGKMEVSG
jgi:hypothetical protein